MALPGFKIPGASGASGAEMMLRSLGLGEMVEMAKAFADSGTLDKIVQFSEGLDALNKRLGNIERELAWAREHRERTDAGASGIFSGATLGDVVHVEPGHFLPSAGEPGILRPDAQSDLGSASGGDPELRDLALPGDPAAGGFAGAGDARSPNGAGRARRSREAVNSGGSK